MRICEPSSVLCQKANCFSFDDCDRPIPILTGAKNPKSLDRPNPQLCSRRGNHYVPLLGRKIGADRCLVVTWLHPCSCRPPPTIPSTWKHRRICLRRHRTGWNPCPKGNRRCHLQFIRSAVHLEPDFAFNSFSNPPFLQFIRSANAPPVRASTRPRSSACCSPSFPS